MKTPCLQLLALVLVLLLSGLAQAQQLCSSSPPTPTADFTLDDANGTAVHNKTGLMWMRCALGQSWDGTTCTGTAEFFDWFDALVQANTSSFAGFDDWRVPNIKELGSIYETLCVYPNINEVVFPARPFGAFWSASVYAEDSDSAWSIFFQSNAHSGSKTNLDHVRLVRGGQEFDSFNNSATRTRITGDDPDPSVVGQAVTINFAVVPVVPVSGSGATVGGHVTVNANSGESCAATVAEGSCEITFATAGARTLTASYAGDTNFDPSVSADEPHTVDENAVPIPTLGPIAMLLLMGLLVVLALCRRGVRL